MQFNYTKAPMYYIDGVPSYKAGEWPGIKSCKFGCTRRIIRPVDQGIIYPFNETVVPKRKRYEFSPSPEYQFKPSVRMCNIKFDREKKPEGLKVTLPQVFTQNKGLAQKKHKFPYMEKKLEEKLQKERCMTVQNALDKELKMFQEFGMAPKPYFSNRTLLKMNFKGKIFDFEGNTGKNTNNIKKDIQYVTTLSEWDKKHIKQKTDVITNANTNALTEPNVNNEGK